MAAPHALITAWARSAVAPVGGAFKQLQAHEIGAPVLQALLARLNLPPEAIDAVVLGNALGAGGNPARLLALAAGLPERCAALSIDTQCCAGLDAVSVAVGLLASGQASVVIAGGAEAWSRAPLRMHRPQTPGEPPVAYERPRFTPEPLEDPDMLEAAGVYAQHQAITRVAQDTYALQSHGRALDPLARMAAEIVPVAGLARDAYPRQLDLQRAARLPAVVLLSPDSLHAISTLGISPKADGAALVVLATAAACERWKLQPRAAWLGNLSVGADPSMPLRAAAVAAQGLLERSGLQADQLDAVELHDAFAVQGLSFIHELGLEASRVNRQGGGLARGHPIGASGAIALVRLLSELSGRQRGLVSVAGAGGLGAAALLEAL